MNVSLYQAASALTANLRWQEAISDNLAAAGVAGFKKQDISFESVQAGRSSTGANPVPQATKGINFKQGELKPTNVPTDMAIEGNGFFEVTTKDDKKVYTRDGEFQLNAKGQLVTKQGYEVQSERGPIRVNPNNPSPLSVSATGEISQGAESKGKLKVVDFKDLTELKRTEGGYMTDPGTAPPQPATQFSLRQGFVETSNVNPATEAASLIAAMRSFETNQRVIQMQDERMGRVINDLARPS